MLFVIRAVLLPMVIFLSIVIKIFMIAMMSDMSAEVL